MSVPLLHVVAGDAQAGRSDFREIARNLLEVGGADLAIHLRLRDVTTSRLFDLTSELSGLASASGGWCVVNERLDVALAAGAQGVQLGRTALPVGVAREVLAAVRPETRGGPALGASVHAVAEARQAEADGASYVVLGTIFASRSHPGVRPQGTAIVERCRGVGVPIIGIGGIDAGRAEALKRAGASGLAVVSAVWAAEDPVEAAGRLIGAWSDAG